MDEQHAQLSPSSTISIGSALKITGTIVGAIVFGIGPALSFVLAWADLSNRQTRSDAQQEFNFAAIRVEMRNSSDRSEREFELFREKLSILQVTVDQVIKDRWTRSDAIERAALLQQLNKDSGVIFPPPPQR